MEMLFWVLQPIFRNLNSLPEIPAELLPLYQAIVSEFPGDELVVSEKDLIQAIKKNGGSKETLELYETLFPNLI